MPGGISEQDVEKVREASDLVAIIGEHTPLRQRGRDFWCCCPFHNEKTPSFKIDVAAQLWHCFGCGEGGDVFSFIMKTQDLNFPEAVLKLAERAHIEIVQTGAGQTHSSSYKARLKDVCKEAAAFFHIQLMRSRSKEASDARAYLASRNLGGQVPKVWNLGFSPGHGALIRHLQSKGFTPEEMIDANVATKKDGKLRDRFFNRIMFPIYDVQGECIAFGGRVVGKGEPKYLNSQETPLFHKSRVLFGLDKAKASLTSTGVAIVVEGYTDVIALSVAGVKNVVATLGTSLTRQHIRILSRHVSKSIVYLFDGDLAGQRAADRALNFIDENMNAQSGTSQIKLCAVTLPDNLDPAEFIASHGVDELNTLIANAKPLIEYGIERRLVTHDLTSPEGRVAALKSALGVLAPIKDTLLAKDYAIQIAGKVHARESDVLDELARLKASAPALPNTPDAHVEPNLLQVPIQLSKQEENRRKFEREFLALLVKFPEIGLIHANTLAQTHFHDTYCAQIAPVLLNALSEKPTPKPAEIVNRIQLAFEGAQNILTASTMSLGIEPEKLGEFLANELEIGDAEDVVNELKSALINPDISKEERESIFASVVGMQKDIAQRKSSHKLEV